MGRGGRSPTPNDDRSRSMNPQDHVGQAAIANTARQRGDYDFNDDYDDIDSNDYGVIIAEVESDICSWGVSREDSEKPQEPRLKVGFDGVGFYGNYWNNLRAKPKSKDE